MGDPSGRRRVPLRDWVDPDPEWRKGWRNRKQAVRVGIAVTAVGLLLVALDPVVPISLFGPSVGCVGAGVATAVGVPLAGMIRWRLRDTWLMRDRWRKEVGPTVGLGLVVTVVLFCVIVLIVRIATGDPTLRE